MFGDFSKPVGGSAVIPTDPRMLEMLGSCDPQLAASLLQPDLIGWGEPSCGWGWEVLNLAGTFTALTADQSIPATLNGIVEADLWVRRVTYTVQRPLAFAGNVFKAQSDYFNRMNPNIDLTLSVKSYCRYLISEDPMPIENIEQVFECVCPVGFVLGCSSQIAARFINGRALASDENPTTVTVSFHATRLPTRYDSCGVNEAVAKLQSQGYLQGVPVKALPQNGS